MKRTCTSNRTLALFATVFLALASVSQSFASLTNGLCAYWPFDNITGCNNKTPDVWSGYDMVVAYGAGNSSGLFLTNFNSQIFLTNDAVRGNAVCCNNGANNNINSYLAFKSVNTNDLVPVNRLSPGSNTVSFWIKSPNYTAVANLDERVWCESDYIRTYASVIDVSPWNNTYDFFIRQTGASSPYGNLANGNHVQGTSTICDGTWHNVTLEMQNDETGTNTGIYQVYVDGVLDTGFTYNKLAGFWKLDTVGVFALVRNGATGITTNLCLVDDLAEWSRNLSTNEIQDYMANGITNAHSVIAPLTVSQFSSDLYSVVQGSSVRLAWQVSSDATGISIDNGIGSVFAVSSCGVGSTNVVVNGTTTYHLILTRGGTSVTNPLTVQTVTGVAAGWNYVGGFNENTLGPLFNQGNWQTLLSSPQTAGYTSPKVLQTVTGNQVLGIAGATEFSAGFFGSHGIGIGSTNTLFFRFYVDPNIGTNDTELGGIPDVDINIGASDAVLRDLLDFNGTPPLVGGSPNTIGAGPGPAVRIFRSAGGVGGPIDLTANYKDGTGTYQYYSYTASVDATGLATGVVYNVWIDIYNNQNDPAAAGGAGAANHYSVTVQKGGDTGTTIPLFPFVVSDRSTNSNETLNEAFICANTTAGQSTNLFVRLDDFYVSTNVNHGIPVPQSSFILGTPASPTSINITGVSKSGNSVTLNWSTVPAGSFSFTVESRASLNSGSWATVQSGITANTYPVTGATASQAFYRVVSP